MLTGIWPVVHDGVGRSRTKSGTTVYTATQDEQFCSILRGEAIPGPVRQFMYRPRPVLARVDRA
jgi:hypothetical protein